MKDAVKLRADDVWLLWVCSLLPHVGWPLGNTWTQQIPGSSTNGLQERNTELQA